ncbi:MAG: hypothetical protein IH627_11270 [Rubrivivax sp.]|nr:hypothetical protein [Rubrivivax sp.]
MEEHDTLRLAAELADAELGVAEELAWPLAVFAAIAAHLKWQSWLITVACAASAYCLAIYRYRRKQAKAEDAYFRAASLGKYARAFNSKA